MPAAKTPSPTRGPPPCPWSGGADVERDSDRPVSDEAAGAASCAPAAPLPLDGLAGAAAPARRRRTTRPRPRQRPLAEGVAAGEARAEGHGDPARARRPSVAMAAALVIGCRRLGTSTPGRARWSTCGRGPAQGHPDVGGDGGRVVDPRPAVAEPLGLDDQVRRLQAWGERTGQAHSVLGHARAPPVDGRVTPHILASDAPRTARWSREPSTCGQEHPARDVRQANVRPWSASASSRMRIAFGPMPWSARNSSCGRPATWPRVVMPMLSRAGSPARRSVGAVEGSHRSSLSRVVHIVRNATPRTGYPAPAPGTRHPAGLSPAMSSRRGARRNR